MQNQPFFKILFNLGYGVLLLACQSITQNVLANIPAQSADTAIDKMYNKEQVKTRLEDVWQLTPKVCVTEQLSESCELELSLQLNLSELATDSVEQIRGKHCLYLLQTLLSCFEVNVNKELTIPNSAYNSVDSAKISFTPIDSGPSQALSEFKIIENGVSLKVWIADKQSLSLLREDGTMVLSQIISVKAREAKKAPRRIKEPWSLF